MSLSKTLPKTMLAVATDEAADRRDSIRYQVTVAAEVIELISGTRFSTRTTDLGPGGCFVDTLDAASRGFERARAPPQRQYGD